MQSRYIVHLVVALLASPWVSTAGAQPAGAGSQRVGTIIHIDGPRIYVDLGAHDQMAPGGKVELLEVVTVTDPTTQQPKSDAFPIGQATITILGENVCIVQADHPVVLKHLKVGDQAKPLFVEQPHQYIDPWIVKPPPPPDPLTQEEAQSLIELITSTLGKRLPERIRVLEDWEIDHETSPLSKDIGRELDSLRALREHLQKAEREFTAQDTRHMARLMRRLGIKPIVPHARQPVALRPLGRINESAEIPLAFLVLNPAGIRTARLYLRQAGDSQFQHLELTRSGAAYLHGLIPFEIVRAPGVEYFVEASATGSQPSAVLGSVDRPQYIDVEPQEDTTTGGERSPRSEIAMSLDYIDFDGFSKDEDQYYQMEVDIMYRFHGPIHAMRIGFGTLNGKNNDYSYLYTELEFALSRLATIMLRSQFGTFETDTMHSESNCTEVKIDKVCDAIGLRTRLRIGREMGTHLILGMSLAQEAGSLYEVLYNWPVLSTFPIQLSAQITDQLDENTGLRFVAQVGWRRIPWVYPSLRISAQARDNDASGVSGGLGLTFQW